MKAQLKRLLKLLVGNYAVYRIFQIELAEFDRVPALPTGFRIEPLDQFHRHHSLMKKTQQYGGTGSLGFGLFFLDTLVGVQWFWYGSRYVARDSWPLKEHQAKSVHLEVLPNWQGKGMASLLKRHSLHLMHGYGFSSVVGRIWHNHKASIRVSKKLGGIQIGWLLYFDWLGKRRKLLIPNHASHHLRFSSRYKEHHARLKQKRA